MNKAGFLPSLRVMLSLCCKRYYEPLRLPHRSTALSLPYTQPLTFSSPPIWISSTGQLNFQYMPPLLPRRFADVASIARTSAPRPSPFRHEVGNRIKFTRLLLGSLALRPASLSFRNSRPPIARTPLLRTTKAYGQFLGRDFNPLAQLLLLRTPGPFYRLLPNGASGYPGRVGPIRAA